MFAVIPWAFSAPVASASQRLVLLDLADRANADHKCWPSQLTIAARTHLSERTVRLALKELEAAGLIKREMQFDTEGHRSSDRIKLLVQSTPDTARRGLTAPDISEPDAPSPPVAPAEVAPSDEFANLFLDDWEPTLQPEHIDRRQDLHGTAGRSCRVNSLANPTKQDKEDSNRQTLPAAETEQPTPDELLRDSLMTILAGHVAPSLARSSLPSRLDRFAPEAVRQAATRVADRLRRGRSDKPIRSWNYLATVLEGESA